MTRGITAAIYCAVAALPLLLASCSMADTQTVLANGNCSSPATIQTNSAIWNGWGADANNTRFQDARAAGLNRETVTRLKLKWAFGLPGVTEGPTQPTVFGGRVFVGNKEGPVYALDAKTGCIYWTYKADVTVRTPIVIDENSLTAFFADMQANMYAVHVNTGELKWKVHVGDHPYASIAGAAKVAANRLFVPLSGGNEEAAAAFIDYPCCTFRGGIVALEADSGREIWRTSTIQEMPKITGKNMKGTPTWGPSGAGIWSSPTLDLQRKTIYVGTGVNYSDPATATSDAILALDMDSGRLLWTAQLTANDRFNFACLIARTSKEGLGNCPSTSTPGFGVGASPILRSVGLDRSLLIVADKSGVVRALDPLHQGKIIWQTRIASGGELGGILWGGASDDSGVSYFPISDWDTGKPETGGGVVAVRTSTGEKIWSAPAPKPGCTDIPGCSAAQPGPATVIPGVLFAGSIDGHLRAYDTSNGKVIWDFNTLQEFQTVNGTKARGGSINRSGPTVAGGMVYVSSGYSQRPAIPGNLLLAFSVEGK